MNNPISVRSPNRVMCVGIDSRCYFAFAAAVAAALNIEGVLVHPLKKGGKGILSSGGLKYQGGGACVRNKIRRINFQHFDPKIFRFSV